MKNATSLNREEMKLITGGKANVCDGSWSDYAICYNCCLIYVEQDEALDNISIDNNEEFCSSACE